VSARSAIHSHNVIRLGSVFASIHSLYQDHGGPEASIALGFNSGRPCGLSAGFHASTSEIRAFAAALIEHADITDKAQAEVVQA
jgi:hypothetical protein